MKKIFILCIFLTQIYAFGQSSVLIEPNGSNGILSVNQIGLSSGSNDTSNPPVAPISGEGTRLMWIPSRSAFRVGTVENDSWNSNNIGLFSFATGVNTLASGRFSTSFGSSTKATGIYSTSMGFYTEATGEFSTSMGRGSTASGRYSTSMGYETEAIGDYSTSIGNGTIASGNYSTSIGLFTEANGNISTSMGEFSKANGYCSTTMGRSSKAIGDYSTAMSFYTTAQPYSSTALGKYNIISGTPTSWVSSEPLLIVGNGTDNTNRNNALTLLKNSNLGLNTATPQYQLTFKDDLGDKISFYYGNTSNTTNHYGIGIQAAKFQLFTPSDDDDVVFGYGRSAAFTENVRFKGKGQVGIGVSNPSEFLDVNGRMRVRHRPGNTAGVWMSNDVNSTAIGDGAFYGLKSNTEAGIFIGGAWRFGVTSTGNMTVGGTVTASCGVLVCSDLRYKKNIRFLNNSLENVLKINGVRYDFKKEEFPERNFSDKNQIGFIAQEIEKILPEMVFTDEKGYKSVDYARLTPVLVEAMKEQQKMIEDLRKANVDLKNVNDKLESRLDKLEAMLNK